MAIRLYCTPAISLSRPGISRTTGPPAPGPSVARQRTEAARRGDLGDVDRPVIGSAVGYHERQHSEPGYRVLKFPSDGLPSTGAFTASEIGPFKEICPAFAEMFQSRLARMAIPGRRSEPSGRIDDRIPDIGSWLRGSSGARRRLSALCYSDSASTESSDCQSGLGGLGSCGDSSPSPSVLSWRLPGRMPSGSMEEVRPTPWLIHRDS